ncbi:MAG TPA: RsmE family RNA methyltransferase [Thermoanaerobaculia bacterium]|nr:RsmE family RNA methyltransferase [Thermoanaerobaculia bacterium]
MLDRFFLDATLETGTSVSLKGDEFHHAARVHRKRVDDEVELFDGRGRGVVAKIIAISADSMELEIAREVVEAREAAIELEIAISLIQPERLELVLQKATELGVSSILPITTARVEVKPERFRGKEERWRKIILEASKQSGRVTLPRIEEIVDLKEALARPGVNVFLDPSGDTRPPKAASMRLFIGPEGGWSVEEVAEARAMGAAVWSLGTRRLRAETAAIAGAALVILGE